MERRNYTTRDHTDVLRELALNLRWSWRNEVRDIFAELDPQTWEASRHNPIRVIEAVKDRTTQRSEPNLDSRIEEAVSDLREYLSYEPTWFDQLGIDPDFQVAYFSAEFGLTECLPIYSGGLGVLAGDHLKSSSDLGVPLVGVGLLYRYGYFRQQIDESGWQGESYDTNEFESLPLERELDPDGKPVLVQIPFPGRTVHAQIWRVQVGRVKLYMLDTDLPENSEQDRSITGTLYGGDLETRIQQELVLGIGGVRALDKLGLTPSVYHMNEGHSAFLALERIRKHMLENDNLSWQMAIDSVSHGLVFTTHTPVEAGHDYFPPELMERYFSAYVQDIGVPLSDLLALGRRNPEDASEYFCMTVLALRMAARSNGVSKLHGEVSRRMWHVLWPERSEAEVPIESITNGVHLSTWLGREMGRVCYSRTGSGELRIRDVQSVADDDLWRAHQIQRQSLIDFARSRLYRQLLRHGVPEDEAGRAYELLDPKSLTVAFARRFATYKRATLLLRDPDRLDRILNHPERPVQVIFAGKAHPKDEGGKQFIQQISQLSQQDRFKGKILFLEDYDVDVARHLVRGADVWLNNPKRPLEASGTSGMKAASNGVLNLSTLDGWWAEAWDEALTQQMSIGWSIGDGTTYDDSDYQAQVEAEQLYALLEQQVTPEFYDRDESGIPRQWVRHMKAELRLVPEEFNTDRMVREYTERFYLNLVGSLQA